MGYYTTFRGHFTLNKVLKPEHAAYLHRFAQLRHVPLDVDKIKDCPDPLREIVGLPVGEDGMYFVGQLDPEDTGADILTGHAPWLLDTFIASGRATITFPSLRCQWIPSFRNWGITDEGEKFYNYIGWLQFLLDHFLIPWGYELSGTVSYQGERGEHGRIVVIDNKAIEIVDGDSLKPRSPDNSTTEEVIKIHWLTTGTVTEAARNALLAADCIVHDLSSEPPIVLIGIPYNCNYYKHHDRDDLGIYRTGEIAVHSKGLRLVWGSNTFSDKNWEGVPLERLMLAEKEYDLILNEDIEINPDDPF